MTLNDELLGAEGETTEFSWTGDDVLLYALAVGAGQEDPLAELDLTTENTAGEPPVVLPTFASIITRVASVPLGAIDHTQLVHASQDLVLHAPLPRAGSALVRARVVEVWDKGSGALVTTETTATALDGAPLATARMTVFIRGEGGFGGERGPSSDTFSPGRAPDLEIAFSPRRDQALLYRLTGDHNPLHSDPEFAHRGGFDRPILHGMCTYGFAGRLLLRAFCEGDPTRFLDMTARFTRPVFPGQELVLNGWRDGDSASFTVRCGDDVVLDHGRLTVLPGVLPRV